MRRVILSQRTVSRELGRDQIFEKSLKDLPGQIKICLAKICLRLKKIHLVMAKPFVSHVLGS